MDVATTLSASEDEAWRTISFAFRLFDEELDRNFMRQTSMPHSYFVVLSELAKSDSNMRMNELSDRLNYSRSRLTRAINALQNEGLVERLRCEQDRRGQQAFITQTGRTALERATSGQTEAARSMIFQRIDKPEIDQLAGICKRLIAAMQQ